MADLVVAEPRKMPMCGCLSRLRIELRPANGAPGTHHQTGAAPVYIRRVDPVGRHPPIVAASFCPFCGTAYE